jgi:predicted transcriptional regulator
VFALAEEDQQELSISKMRELHKNRWIAITVTKRDKNGQPTAGKIVAEDVDRYRLRQNIIKYNDICIFYSGDPPFPLFL